VCQGVSIGSIEMPAGGCQPRDVPGVDEWLAWVMPWRCVLCNEPSRNTPVCAGCRADLPWLGPEAGPAAEVSVGAGARFRVHAPLAYEYPVDRMIAAAKFRGDLPMARALGELLAGTLPGNARADLIVPVPLHRRRLAERGYNQALEIARPVATRTGIALAAGLCERVRATVEQSGLDADARRRNLRDAFRARRGCPGARLVILDDVVTTGSTAASLGRALLDAGAATVEVWAVARTL
jgi:ComF family protein